VTIQMGSAFWLPKHSQLYIIPPVRNDVNFDGMTSIDCEDARSVPKYTGQNGRYKTALPCWG